MKKYTKTKFEEYIDDWWIMYLGAPYRIVMWILYFFG